MLHYISKKIACLISDKDDEYPIEIYTYGIELMISSLIGTILIIFSGIIFHLLIESLIFTFCLSGIRFFSGGYHAKTYLRCNIVYLISYALVMITYMLYFKYLINYNISISLVLIIVSTLILILFAPIENENKKIDDSQKNKFKWISIIILLIECFGSLIILGLFDFHQVLVVFPTILIVDISIIVEVIMKNHKFNTTTE